MAGDGAVRAGSDGDVGAELALVRDATEEQRADDLGAAGLVDGDGDRRARRFGLDAARPEHGVDLAAIHAGRDERGLAGDAGDHGGAGAMRPVFELGATRRRRGGAARLAGRPLAAQGAGDPLGLDAAAADDLGTGVTPRAVGLAGAARVLR